MNRLLKVIVFLSIFYITNGDEYIVREEDDGDEDLNYYLGRLYEESKEETLNPHDMLKYPGEKNQPVIKGVKETGMFGSDLKTRDQASCDFHSLKLDEAMQKLEVCKEQLESLIRQVEADKKKMRNLENKFLNEGPVDMKTFYSRVIQHFWSVLKLKEAKNILKETDEAVIRHLRVRIGKEDLSTLQNFMEHQDNVQQVDVFLQDAFELDAYADSGNYDFSIQSWMERIFYIVELGKNVEMWLYVLCFGFLILGIWAVYLFIKDIQRELRWMRIIVMMTVLVFLISCLWHWRHMHKVAESRRHAQLMKEGFRTIPEACKPGGQGSTASVWDWIKVRAFGGSDVCEKYFEELMIDPSEEITPAMVIAETLAKFFLLPLQHLGSESAKLITNFYLNVPAVYLFPATVLFIVLLIIILFAFCGYGIDFPLWMGGIRPIYRTETADTSSVDRITKEAIAQLKSDREKFMTESRIMLTDIAQAATSSQAQLGIQPLLMMSSGIMESELERLIARKFSDVLPQVVERASISDLLPRQQCISHQNPEDVHIVTSTPLRRQYELQRSSSNSFSSEDVRDGNERIVTEKEHSINGAGTMVVTTDAVHYRLKGSPRKLELPSKNTIISSPSSTACKIDKSCEDRIKSMPIMSPREREGDMPVVRRRAVGPVHDSKPSHSHSGLSLNQSLNATHNEAFSPSDESGSGGTFYNKVRSILEDSANSSMNLDNSDVSDDHDKIIKGGRSVCKMGRQKKGDEMELSASSVKFMDKIERVMTP